MGRNPIGYWYEQGQALLIVILIMVVGLTVGLAVASRSLTNTRNATEEENSQRAFSNAEAGIERLLKDQAGNVQAPNGLDYKASILPVGGTEFLLNGGNTIKQDDGATVWLVNHTASGDLDFSALWPGSSFTVYWGTDSGGCEDAAIEVILVTGTNGNPNATKTNPTSRRYTFDACAGRKTNNNFSGVGGSGTIQGKTLQHSGVVSFPASTGVIARVIPLYKENTVVGVQSGTIFPAQGKKIESTGTYQNTTRKLTVYQGFPELFNEFFQYNLLVVPK